MYRVKEEEGGEKVAAHKCAWLEDYSYRVAEELMRCVIRQI